MTQKQLSVVQLAKLVEKFFKFGYSNVRNNEYIGAVEYRNGLGAGYLNIIGLCPNDDVIDQPLTLTIYSLCYDCTWQEAFETYTKWVTDAVPELVCIEEHEIPEELNDVWEFTWRD